MLKKDFLSKSFIKIRNNFYPKQIRLGLTDNANIFKYLYSLENDFPELEIFRENNTIKTFPRMSSLHLKVRFKNPIMNRSWKSI